MLPRLNIQSGGWWVLQQFDDQDPLGSDYDESNLKINYAARYEHKTTDDGIPYIGQTDDTHGPVGQWVCWAGVGGSTRSMAQWGQVFVGKVTSADPLKVKAISNTAGDLDTGLAETSVTSLSSTAPSVDDVGLVVAGTDLHSQQLFFFRGGGGGTAFFPARIISGSNPYTCVAVETPDPSSSDTGDEFEATEMNGSSAIVNGTRVWMILWPGDSNYYFWFPIRTCLS